MMTMALSYVKRFTRLILGLVCYAVGIYLTIQANVGLAPWEAFSMGISIVSGYSFGNVALVTGILIIGIDYLLHEKIGFGTLLNAIFIGKFVDVIFIFNPVPKMESFAAGIGLMLLGQVMIAVASVLYIGSSMGCGPRDALMVALGKKFYKAPIGLVRAGLEGTVLLIGFLFGAKVGVGTVIAVFGMGFILQGVFALFKFKVREIEHENFADTVRIWREKPKPSASALPDESEVG